MAKSELKTRETKASVKDFLDSIEDEKVFSNCQKIAAMMEKATGAKPKMWGANIVGFGERVLRYDSGRELKWLEIAFSPRKQNLTLYVVDGSTEQSELLGKLGKHKTGKGCLYIKRLSDVNEEILEEIIEKSVEKIRTE